MGFFKDLREDISQAVNELLPNDELFGLVEDDIMLDDTVVPEEHVNSGVNEEIESLNSYFDTGDSTTGESNVSELGLEDLHAIINGFDEYTEDSNDIAEEASEENDIIAALHEMQGIISESDQSNDVMEGEAQSDVEELPSMEDILPRDEAIIEETVSEVEQIEEPEEEPVSELELTEEPAIGLESKEELAEELVPELEVMEEPVEEPTLELEPMEESVEEPALELELTEEPVEELVPEQEATEEPVEEPALELELTEEPVEELLPEVEAKEELADEVTPELTSIQETENMFELEKVTEELETIEEEFAEQTEDSSVMEDIDGNDLVEVPLSEDTETDGISDIDADNEENIVEKEVNIMENNFENVEANNETTVITKGTIINGSIISDGSLEINGTITGDVECEGKLTINGNVSGHLKAAEVVVSTPKLDGGIDSKGDVKIGVGTIVIGDVTAKSATISGAVKGEVDVQGPVVVDSTAIVKGNITAKSVQVNNGAIVDGYCKLSYAEVDIDNFFEAE